MKNNYKTLLKFLLLRAKYCAFAGSLNRRFLLTILLCKVKTLNQIRFHYITLTE